MPRAELFPTTPDALVALGPTIGVQIGLGPGYAGEEGVFPELPPVEYPALVDTGAVDSCIDESLARSLRLAPMNRSLISGVGGIIEVNTYLAQAVVPSLSLAFFGELAGVHLQAGGQEHVALLGRTFLRDHRLVYDGRTGLVTLERD